MDVCASLLIGMILGGLATLAIQETLDYLNEPVDDDDEFDDDYEKDSWRDGDY